MVALIDCQEATAAIIHLLVHRMHFQRAPCHAGVQYRDDSGGPGPEDCPAVGRQAGDEGKHRTDTIQVRQG